MTSKYQNSILEIYLVRMTPYSRPVRNRGSCRKTTAVCPIIQYEQFNISLMRNMSNGNRQKKATFIQRLLQMAGNTMSPQMMVRTRTKMKTCFDLCFSLKDMTEQQQMTMAGQVKKLRLRKKLAMMMGMERSRMMFEDFQGSIEIVKAMVRMISQQGKFASWMRYKIEKVTEQATKSSMKYDLKLNLQGIFLTIFYIAFSYDFIYTLSSFTCELLIFNVFSLLTLSYSFWKDLTDERLRWRVRTDYLRRLVFIISSMTWLYCFDDSASRKRISISRTLEVSSMSFFFQLLSILICIIQIISYITNPPKPFNTLSQQTDQVIPKWEVVQAGCICSLFELQYYIGRYSIIASIGV